MIGAREATHASVDIAEVAAAWVLEEEAGLSLHRNGLLEAWLAEADEHVTAYNQARFAYDAVGRQGAEPEMMALREAALRARSERFGLSPALVAASVAALAVMGFGGWWAVDRTHMAPGPKADATSVSNLVVDPDTARYETAVGERSTVTLPDGSIMTLNTASVAQIDYDGSERGVRLLAGQAMFTVAHDRPLPFRVYAGDRVITATGTAFEVYLNGDRVRVALLEGVVKVSPRGKPTVSLTSTDEVLSAGEVLTAGPGLSTSVRSQDVARLVGWRGGLVAFEDTPLSEAVAEINRYTNHPVILTDSSVGRYRVSGTFRVGEPERFARTMSELFPVDLTSSVDGRSTLANRPQ